MAGTKLFRVTSVFFFFALILNTKFDFGVCFSSTLGQGRSLQNNGYQYTIDKPTFEWDGFRIHLDYTFSASIQDEIISYAIVSGKDCASGIISDTEIDSSLTKASSTSARLSLLLRPENIDGASYVKEFENFSTIGICARVWINRAPTSTGSDGEIVSAPRKDYILIQADLDELTGITNVEDDETINWGVDVFRCDKSNQPESFVPALQNGEKLRLCLKRTAKTRKDGITIGMIKTFQFSRDGVIQKAVETYGVDEVTTVTCPRGSNVCVIESVLSNSFFHSPGYVKAEGVVVLQYGRERRSLRSVQFDLQSSTNMRSLAEYEKGEMVTEKLAEVLLSVEPTNKVYSAEAFPCDNSNKPIKNKALNEGEHIKVCIQPNEEARDAGVYINSIESFSYGRANDDKTQIALDSFGRVANDRTKVDCASGLTICSINSTLEEWFFDQDGRTVTVVTGYAILQFGAHNERRRASIVHRDLLEKGDLGFAGKSEVDAYFDTVGRSTIIEENGPVENWFEELFDQWELSDTHITILYIVAVVLIVLICLCCCGCLFFFFYTRRRKTHEVRNKTNIHIVNNKISENDYSNSTGSHSRDGGSNSRDEVSHSRDGWSHTLDEESNSRDEGSNSRGRDSNPDEYNPDDIDNIDNKNIITGGGDAVANSTPKKSSKKKKKKKKKKEKKIEDESANDGEDCYDTMLNDLGDGATDSPTPGDDDVCFDAEDHPGTKAFLEAIQQTLVNLGPVSYSPAVYRNIKRRLPNRRFFVCEQDSNGEHKVKKNAKNQFEWREATKRELIDIFWKHYEEGKSKVH